MCPQSHTKEESMLLWHKVHSNPPYRGKAFRKGFTKKSSFTWDSKVEDVGFPGGPVVKNPPANAGDMGSNPGLRRSHMPRSN